MEEAAARVNRAPSPAPALVRSLRPVPRDPRRPALPAHTRSAARPRAATPAAVLRRIHFVLVSPGSPGNVGSAARAVKNMGIGRLSIVEPVHFRDPDFFATEARRFAVHAGDVLARLRSYETLDDAVRPGTYLVATTAKRSRSIPLSAAGEAARRLVEIARTTGLAVLFGPEDHGLPNRLLSRASEALTIPASARYPVLNLAQAVMLVGYEIRRAALAGDLVAQKRAEPDPHARPAEMDGLVREATEALALVDFLKAHNAERVAARLRALLVRANPTADDVRMLRGACRQVRWIAGLAGRRRE